MKKLLTSFVLMLLISTLLINVFAEEPYEDKLKEESKNYPSFTIHDQQIIDELLAKKQAFEKDKQEKIDNLTKLIENDLKSRGKQFFYKNDDTTEVVLAYTQKVKSREEVQLLEWYLNNSVDSINDPKLMSDVLKHLGMNKFIKNSNIFNESEPRNSTIGMFGNIAFAETYSRSAAAEYAITYYDNYNNSSYPSFGEAGEGGDCANFISQCLYAGGKTWAEVSSNYDWAENWWCKPGATDDDGDTRITLTWKTVTGFKNHWNSRAAEYSANTVSSMKSNWSTWWYDLYRGDAIQLADSDGDPWHTMIICDYLAGSDFYLAAHTNDTKSALFNSYILNQVLSDTDKVLVYEIE